MLQLAVGLVPCPLPQGPARGGGRNFYIRHKPGLARLVGPCSPNSYRRLDADGDEAEALMFPTTVSITGDLGSGKSTGRTPVGGSDGRAPGFHRNHTERYGA